MTWQEARGHRAGLQQQLPEETVIAEPSGYPPCPAEESASGSGSGFVWRRHTANYFRGFQLHSSLGIVESILGFPSLRTHGVFPDTNDDKIHIKVTTVTICKCAAQRH